MKVLLLNGSPHKAGCTQRALQEIQNQLTLCGIESKIFWIGMEPIAGCIGCGQCREKKAGCFRNDLVNAFVEEAKEYDGFVLGSPVYYASPNGSLLAFLDRVFYSGGRHFQYKPMATIVSCRRGGATASFDVLNKYATISNMIVVGSQYWNMVHGNTKEEVEQDAEGLQTMRTIAKNMAWILCSIEAGKRLGVNLPEKEPRLQTNFIRKCED